MSDDVAKRRLGRGLAALIGEMDQPQVATKAPAPADGKVPIEFIMRNARNPRRHFAEADLADLAQSIREHGVVQPVVVRPSKAEAGRYEIIAGERRWRAAQQAGLAEVPVIIREVDDRVALEIAIVENVQRADLNAIEEAGGYRELLDRFGYSQEQLSEIIGKSRSHVANTLRLLRLPESVQGFVQSGKLSPGHARALIGREDAETFAERIIAEDLTVREVEALVQANIAVTPSTPVRKAREKDADTRAFEKELADALGLKVEIKRSSGESGNLVIKYGNYDQLEYIRMRLTGMGS